MAYNFEEGVTSFIEDGAGDELLRCLRVSADRDASVGEGLVRASKGSYHVQTHVAVLNSIDKPAHLASGSLGCIQRVDSNCPFLNVPLRRKSPSVRLLRTKGEFVTAESSVAR